MSTIAERVRARFSQSEEPTVQERVASRYTMKRLAVHWEGKLVGQDCRLQWSRDSWVLEELPQKGKKKLRVAKMQNLFGIISMRRNPGTDLLMPQNILRDAKPVSSDSYDEIKSKIEKAMGAAVKELIAQNKDDPKDDMKWVQKSGTTWYENEVYFLEVVPENVDPFKAEGKDFTVSVAWGDFKAYSPSSDFQQADPHYTVIEEKSPGAARKLYNTLKTDPKALKSVSWDDFSKWLDTKKIGYKYRHSQWH